MTIWFASWASSKMASSLDQLRIESAVRWHDGPMAEVSGLFARAAEVLDRDLFLQEAVAILYTLIGADAVAFYEQGTADQDYTLRTRIGLTEEHFPSGLSPGRFGAPIVPRAGVSVEAARVFGAAEAIIAGVYASGRMNGLLIAANTKETRFNDAAIGICDLLCAVIGSVMSRREYSVSISRNELFFDTLTGLVSRHHLLEHLRQEHHSFELCRMKYSVIFIDVDRFRSINSVYGFDFGDALLVQLTERILGVFPDHRLVARYGDDEFVIVVSDSDERSAIRIARKILAAIGRAYTINTQHIRITASAGIAVANDEYHNGFQVLRAAEAAMQHARTNVNRKLSLYEGGMIAGLSRGLDIERELRLALLYGGLRLEFQPIIDVNTRSVTSMESLIRWDHPERGRLMPGAFIEDAERSDIIHDVGRWVLRQACVAARRWLMHGHNLSISVNVAPAQLQNRGFLRVVFQVLQETGLPPENLILEITEGSLLVMDKSSRVRKTLVKLREHGIRIAVDDFGTGYACLANLFEYPADIFKIDRSLIHDIESERSRQLAGNILRLVSDLGKPVVVEGIETKDQERFALQFPSVLLQGYLYSRPVSFAKSLAFLRSPECCTGTMA